MERLAVARWGLWVFTLGIFAWIFPNVGDGNTANVLTDIAIVAFGTLAAIGLPRAVDGLGTGMLRWGLGGVAACQAGQNVNTAIQGLNAVNTAPVAVVLLASVAVVIGAWRWAADEWDLAATPWLAGGFLGFAFEPIYYFTRGATEGNPFGPYFVGSLGVAAGALLAAWAFRPVGAEAETPPAPGPAASPSRGRRSKS